MIYHCLMFINETILFEKKQNMTLAHRLDMNLNSDIYISWKIYFWESNIWMNEVGVYSFIITS